MPGKLRSSVLVGRLQVVTSILLRPWVVVRHLQLP
jgi:hypothetical protein